jgi:DNA-binding transcriptional ArsR family regulator
MSSPITNPYKKTARLLKAMAHPVRLMILDILLNNQEECVCHLEALLGYRQAYLSQHLMSMREAGLVADRREGRNIFYHIRSPDLAIFIQSAVRMGGPERPAISAQPIDCTCPKCTQKNFEVFIET